jgi:hypothetical protein
MNARESIQNAQAKNAKLKITEIGAVRGASPNAIG